ncbi:FAZ1 [Symbiodinium natans]|uniref:FAZ1 protein n=1 Tax=Symbiodinium natans TaxID=878477 RepID=A0A812J8R7_9DINO|nr:FAZ1 [Symbiodinium natans]
MLEHAGAHLKPGLGDRSRPDASQPTRQPLDPDGKPIMFFPTSTSVKSLSAECAEFLPAAAPTLGEAITDLSRLQLVLAVPTVSALRHARPLRRHENELYVAQFVLQSTHGKFNKYLSTPEGKCELHPCLKMGPADVIDGEDLDGDGSFGFLNDGTPVIYQTNGIARTEEALCNKAIKCCRTGAPGHYMETRMLVSRRRDTTGLPCSGLARAKTMRSREDVVANLFYSFTSTWQIYACAAPVGELGDDDSGERILVRRSVRNFVQHHFHDFPIAKHLADLLDRENQLLVNKHSLGQDNVEREMYEYDYYTLRAWQTYECEGKPPEEDLGRRLVDAARNGQVSEVVHLVKNCGCDLDTIVAEFGCIGSGKTGIFTRNPCGYAEERTALIAAVQAGWQSVVELLLEFVRDGRGSVNVVCHEWNPKGIGGECLRPCYTALDQARLYHRDMLLPLLSAAGALSHKKCKRVRRTNPFDVRAHQDKGDKYTSFSDEKPTDSQEDFTFFEWADEAQMDDEMKNIISELKTELRDFPKLEEAEQTKLFRRLCARWHPDKHPDDKKVLATRVFQWIQHVKVDAWESRAWSA